MQGTCWGPEARSVVSKQEVMSLSWWGPEISALFSCGDSLAARRQNMSFHNWSYFQDLESLMISNVIFSAVPLRLRHLFTAQQLRGALQSVVPAEGAAERAACVVSGLSQGLVSISLLPLSTILVCPSPTTCIAFWGLLLCLPHSILAEASLGRSSRRVELGEPSFQIGWIKHCSRLDRACGAWFKKPGKIWVTEDVTAGGMYLEK